MSVLGHRLRAYVRPSSFDPLSISGLQFWIDSDDAATFTYSSGVIVSQWNDKSGNARHASESTVARQPARNGTRNSRSTVVFDGAALNGLHAAAITLAQPVTVFAVAKANSFPTNNNQILGNETSCPTLWANTGFWSLFAGSVADSSTASDTSWHYFTAVFNGASSSLRLDATGLTVGNPGTSGWDAERINIGSDVVYGSVGEWDGHIAELLIYDTALGTTDRNNVESYLATKWGF